MSGTLQVGGITLGTHNSGTGKVDITNAGTASVTTLNTTSIASGTINSAVTVQQKTALITGESTAGSFNPVEDSSTHYTVQLNTEQDPYNFVTLNSNTVTVTEAGTYFIHFNSGGILAYNESSSSSYTIIHLERGGSLLKAGQQALVPDIYDVSPDWTVQIFGNYVGTLSANDTLKIRIVTNTGDYELKTWGPSNGQTYVGGYMIIQKIG